MDNHLTIDEAAERLGVSKDTVRRRIKRGDLRAAKASGPYGDQYFIPESEITTAQEITDVVPVVRQVSIQDLATAVEAALCRAIEPMQQEIQSLQAALENERAERLKAEAARDQLLKEQGDRLQQILAGVEESHRETASTRELLDKQEQERRIAEAERDQFLEERDKRMVEQMRVMLETNKPQSWWKRFFGR